MLVIFLYKGINMNILYYFNAKENKKYIFVYLYWIETQNPNIEMNWLWLKKKKKCIEDKFFN